MSKRIPRLLQRKWSTIAIAALACCIAIAACHYPRIHMCDGGDAICVQPDRFTDVAACERPALPSFVEGADPATATLNFCALQEHSFRLNFWGRCCLAAARQEKLPAPAEFRCELDEQLMAAQVDYNDVEQLRQLAERQMAWAEALVDDAMDVMAETARHPPIAKADSSSVAEAHTKNDSDTKRVSVRSGLSGRPRPPPTGTRACFARPSRARARARTRARVGPGIGRSRRASGPRHRSASVCSPAADSPTPTRARVRARARARARERPPDDRSARVAGAATDSRPASSAGPRHIRIRFALAPVRRHEPVLPARLRPRHKIGSPINW